MSKLRLSVFLSAYGYGNLGMHNINRAWIERNSVPKRDSTQSTQVRHDFARQRGPRKERKRHVGEKSPAISKKDYCELARLQVFAAWPKIVEGLIDKAMGGGYQQTKLLLDLCDLTQVDTCHSIQQDKQQLCDKLLEDLLSPSAKSENPTTKDDVQSEKNFEVE